LTGSAKPIVSEMTRIAFTLIGGKSWTGGYNYLLNLLQVIAKHRSGFLQPVLFFGTDVADDEVRPFLAIRGVKIVTSSMMNTDRRTASLLKSVFLGADPAIQRLFKEQQIDVVFENAQFHGARLGIPAIAWIPDFQHRELPQLFSRAAWWKRELGLRAQVAAKRAIMLSSRDACNACERNYPDTIGRTHIVRFAVHSDIRPDHIAVELVREVYKLPERYFYLPNQFWQHKNHMLVVDALVLLKQAGYLINVVASGKQFDHNRPNYFERFAAHLDFSSVSDQFHLLGLIPYEHVAPLMVGSEGVINPSLFEGWSTTVEEARALQVPLVLSDLAVHREQVSRQARFFNRKSADSLAEALIETWQRRPSSDVGDSVSHTTAIDPVQRFAYEFVDLVHFVVGKDQCTTKVTP
jgi:glycosyltransferase involved in cell wall biosynthesis